MPNLLFPMRGLNKRLGFQQQPPYTTPLALNVRPKGTLQDRARGGSRPGLAKAFEEQIGAAAHPIRMAHMLTHIPADSYAKWKDGFNQGLGDNGLYGWLVVINQWWDQGDVGWPSDDYMLISDTQPYAYLAVDSGRESHCIRDKLAGFDNVNKPYKIELAIEHSPESWPVKPDQYNGYYDIYFQLDDSSAGFGANEYGARVRLKIEDNTGAATVYLTTYDGGVVDNESSGDATHADDDTDWGRLVVTVTPGSPGSVAVTWRGVAVTLDGGDASNDIPNASSTKSLFGFGFEQIAAYHMMIARHFQLSYFDPDAPAHRRMLVASANGEVWQETTAGGEMEVVGADATLADDRMLQAVDFEQKLYIADYGLVVDYDAPVGAVDNVADIGLTATINLEGATLPDGTAIADWRDETDPVLNLYDFLVTLTDSTGATTQHVITVIAELTLTVSPDVATGKYGVRIERGPKVFDPNAATPGYELKLWTAETDGTIPLGCPCIAKFLDRIVLGGADQNPHLWTACRAFDPLRWADSVDFEDTARPVSSQNARGASIGQPIKALIAPRDDSLIVGCTNSIYEVRGDPTYGGTQGPVSEKVGIIGLGAWTLGPSNELIFLNTDGVWMLAGGQLANLTAGANPEEFSNIVETEAGPSIAFDMEERGIRIMLTQEDSEEVAHYWYDWATKGLWPDSLDGDHEPTSLVDYDGRIVLGGRDGYLRDFDPQSSNDDGEDIEAYVYIGPIMLGNVINDGSVEELIAILGQNSGDVDWELYVAETAEELIGATAVMSGLWSAGRSYSDRPMRRGQAFMLKVATSSVTGATAGAWAMESIMARLARLGPHYKA